MILCWGCFHFPQWQDGTSEGGGPGKQDWILVLEVAPGMFSRVGALISPLSPRVQTGALDWLGPGGPLGTGTQVMLEIWL